MEINVLKDFDQINISSKRHIDNLIEKIKGIGLGNDKSICLDLTDCQTDYPETPRLIDFLLFHLAGLEGKKELKIIFNGLGSKELYILHDIVLEGKYFEIHNKITSPEEVFKWTEIMKRKLSNDGIRLEIFYLTDNKSFLYGEDE